MKRTDILMIAALTCAFALFAACDDEKKPIETMTSGFMTGYTDSEGFITLLKDDFGNEYTISEKKDTLIPDTAIRVVTSIALDNSGTARILQTLYPISYKAPEDSTINDTLKVKDPVKFYTAYIGGGYLNITLGIKVQKEGTKHLLAYTHLNASNAAAFTFYHNAFGDGELYTKNAYISIPLSFYGLQKNDTVSVSFNSYSGDSILNILYK